MKFLSKGVIVVLTILITCTQSSAQRYLADYDSTFYIRDTVKPFLSRMKNLYFSGYIQPQYQVAQKEGAPYFGGADFSEFSDNRFMLRRARVKIDYVLPSKENGLPNAIFTYQVDATERGVVTRDMFLRVFEPKKHYLSLYMGLFARPFGYEVNLSSSYRETPERGRMSQILMPTERDLGAMVSYEPSFKAGKKPVKFDIGLFNGQGLAKGAVGDFDSYKDLITRLTIKPAKIADNLFLSGGLSLLDGGWRQATKYKLEMDENDSKVFLVDSSSSNIGDKAPRQYYGADAQLAYKHGWGKTEIRGEYWRGTQPGTASTTTTPGTMPTEPTYIRDFDGAFFYFLQNIVNKKNELMVKYDWYDPNRHVAKEDIGKAGSKLTAADIKYVTWGVGFTHYFTDELKFLVYYDIVKNEKTSLSGYTSDNKDNVFTARLQLRF
ncbi:porin [Chitinophagaceae bacterium LB-8]|uniref:Porin n=1 Tax=Paraflavisolibacter caeni TaxID=2982496 RepID=A0A9X2XTF2_9BACT|nr:porin [Paraflavisolibacter caeni]MCU7548290.1 porin [Paraflavisolibacter caeni]